MYAYIANANKLLSRAGASSGAGTSDAGQPSARLID